ncbi:uncharacterized protein PG986_002032 [Apiospora aurea]|uniref:Uncharacterized protein n=1 Tax=Apiospora aurea TaxID=335848 RepID=A0ABR1R0C2_9PEZI
MTSRRGPEDGRIVRMGILGTGMHVKIGKHRHGPDVPRFAYPQRGYMISYPSLASHLRGRLLPRFREDDFQAFCRPPLHRTASNLQVLTGALVETKCTVLRAVNFPRPALKSGNKGRPSVQWQCGNRPVRLSELLPASEQLHDELQQAIIPKPSAWEKACFAWFCWRCHTAIRCKVTSAA